MIFGDMTKQEIKIAKGLENRLKKRGYTDITIKKDTISEGYFTAAATEPFARRVINLKMNITEMKTKLQ